MPGHRCAVSTCNNSKVSVKKQGLDIIFHSFPKATTPEGLNIRNQWIDFCNRDTLNATNANICSIHFTKDDYERDLKNELLGLPCKRLLKKTAVPTLFKPFEEYEEIKIKVINDEEEEAVRSEDKMSIEDKCNELSKKLDCYKLETSKKINDLKQQIRFWKNKTISLHKSLRYFRQVDGILNKVMFKNHQKLRTMIGMNARKNTRRRVIQNTNNE